MKRTCIFAISSFAEYSSLCHITVPIIEDRMFSKWINTTAWRDFKCVVLDVVYKLSICTTPAAPHDRIHFTFIYIYHIKTKTINLCSTLSKQTRLSWPHMLILWGLMQKIPICFKRLCAYTMPAVMAAGKAGGTVMVMMSRDSMMMVLAGTWLSRNKPSS